MSLRSIILSGAIATLAGAFSTPTNATWGALLTPDLSTPVTQGQTFDVTWDPASHPTDGVTVSLVLCHGPSKNCVTSPTAIVEGVPAALKKYSWSVPCDLAAGTQSTDTGYGMLIIVDGTGEFQYSTQFSVLSNPSCSSSTTSSASTNSSSTSTSSASGEVTAVSIGPGQGGYKNATTTARTTTAGISGPSSIVSASGLSTTTVGTTQSHASASASAPASTSLGVSGAGVKAQIGGLFGLVVGAFAMVAL